MDDLNANLLKAASRVDAAEIGRLIDLGAFPDAAGEGGLAALHLAAQSDRPHAKVGLALGALLAGGASVNVPADDGATPADIANSEGKQAVYAFLRKNGGKPSRPPNRLLMLAAVNGSATTIKALLADGAEIDDPREGGHRAECYLTPLGAAVWWLSLIHI